MRAAHKIGLRLVAWLVITTSAAVAQVTLPHIPQPNEAHTEPVLLDLQGVRYRQADIDAINKAVHEPRLHALSAGTVQRLMSYKVGPVGPCRYTFSRESAQGGKQVLAIVTTSADHQDIVDGLPDARAGSYIALNGYEVPASVFGADRFKTVAGGKTLETLVERGKVVAVGPAVAM